LTKKKKKKKKKKKNKKKNKKKKKKKEYILFDSKTRQSRRFITPAVTEPVCQKTRRSTMLATHRIKKLPIDRTRKLCYSKDDRAMRAS